MSRSILPFDISLPPEGFPKFREDVWLTEKGELVCAITHEREEGCRALIKNRKGEFDSYEYTRWSHHIFYMPDGWEFLGRL